MYDEEGSWPASEVNAILTMNATEPRRGPIQFQMYSENPRQLTLANLFVGSVWGKYYISSPLQIELVDSFIWDKVYKLHSLVNFRKIQIYNIFLTS